MEITGPSTVIQNAAYISMGILLIAFFLGFWRMVKGPGLADRVLILDLIASLVIGIIVAITAFSGEIVFMNVAVMIALVSFMGTIAFAKYMKKKFYDN